MQKEILDKLLDTKGFPYYEMLKEISVFHQEHLLQDSYLTMNYLKES